MWNDKGPRRHKETWWWNEDVAEAVREKKIKYGKKTKKRHGRSIRRAAKRQSYFFSKEKETEGMCK